MSGSPIAVASAGTDRLGALAPVFGRAFVDDQMMRWPMGRWGDPEDQITRCFSFFLEMALGSGVVWEAGAACGAAVWIPPGRFESWVDHPWNQPRIHGLTDDAGVRYEGFWRWIDDHSPEEPLWQLDSIAVEPVQQGRGYGRALIVHGLEQARADGTGAFLSTATERNVSIYGRCGFRVVEDLAAPGGGPRVWFMRWDP